MKKFGPQLKSVIADLGGDSDAARVNMRVQQVRARYRSAIERVYDPATARFHLAHTNSVIIRGKSGVKTLTVYVDDSMCAADLNAQRELIKLSLLELFGEEVQDFEIMISRWRKYREVHPYLADDRHGADDEPSPVPLDADEESYVTATASQIADEKVRESLKKAMKADLERKKGERVDSNGKNTK